MNKKIQTERFMHILVTGYRLLITFSFVLKFSLIYTIVSACQSHINQRSESVRNLMVSVFA